MWMHSDLIKDFPECAKLPQALDSWLRKNPKVRDAFLTACTAEMQRKDPRAARAIALPQALKWATGPRVHVARGGPTLPSNTCGFQPAIGGQRNLLLITPVIFDAFERGSAVDRDRNAQRLIAIVLHESVHWVRQEAEASTEVYEGRDVLEAGVHFERLAFGTHHCAPDEIEDAILSLGQ